MSCSQAWLHMQQSQEVPYKQQCPGVNVQATVLLKYPSGDSSAQKIENTGLQQNKWLLIIGRDEGKKSGQGKIIKI